MLALAVDPKQAEDWKTSAGGVANWWLEALVEARNHRKTHRSQLAGAGLLLTAVLIRCHSVLVSVSSNDTALLSSIVSAVECQEGSRKWRRAGRECMVSKAPGIEVASVGWNFSTHVGEDKKYPTV